jgi:hypothetical protein
MAGVTVLWLAAILLVDGRVVVGQFPTLRDCRTSVAYALVNQDVVAVHRTPDGRACRRLTLRPGEGLKGVAR